MVDFEAGFPLQGPDGRVNRGVNPSKRSCSFEVDSDGSYGSYHVKVVKSNFHWVCLGRSNGGKD